MQLDEEKIKKCAKTGAALDFPAQIVMLVFLLGAGITSVIEAFNEFSLTLYFVLVSIFMCGALVGLVLYLIGGHNRNYVNRQVFAYCEQITDGVIDGWCSGDALALDIALSKDPDTAVFTVTDGKNAPAVYDLTCSLKSSASAAIFIASCVCRTAARIKAEIGNGKIYKNVSYRLTADEGASAEQYFVKEGKPDEKELGIAAKQYEKVCKKCKK